MGHRVMTAKQVCDFLAISDRSLRRMVREGTREYAKVRGGWRFLEEDLMALFGDGVDDLELAHCDCEGACDCPSEIEYA